MQDKLNSSREQKLNNITYYKYLTEKELEEIKKCRDDFFYFVKYIKVSDATTRKPTPVELYEKQHRFIELMNEYHYTIVLKSRQTGMSTVSGMYALWIQLFYPNSAIGILSADENKQVDFLARHVRRPFLSLPTFLREKVVYDNKQSLKFGNGSEILSTTSTTNAFRSKTLNYLIMDEAQFIENAEDIFAAVVGTMSKMVSAILNKENTNVKPGGISIISTPNGIGNWYHKMWMNALSGANMYKPLKFHWSEIPDYTEEWYNQMKATFNYDERKINQELEMTFIGSGDTFFNAKILEKLKGKDPIMIQKLHITNDEEYQHDAELYMFESPVPNRKYAMGVDVQSKIGSDRSAIQVVDLTNSHQVQEYLGLQVNFKDLAKIIYEVNRIYPSIIAVERNNNGEQVIEHLLEYNNLDLFRDSMMPGSTSTADIIMKNDKFGFLTSQKTRPQILNYLYELVNDYKPDAPFLYSERLINEMLQFEYNFRNKPEAQAGYHDDLVMAFAIAEYVQKLFAKSQFSADPIDTLKLISQFVNSQIKFNDNEKPDISVPIKKINNKSIFR